MKNSALQSFRLLVAVAGGVLCLALAMVYQFHAPQLSTPFARLGIAAFGLAWLAQAFVIRNRIRETRG